MAIRVQPAEIEIPENDPFANDLLGRKESIEALTTLLGNIEGPCVMAVDASWGMGKTTFLRLWAQHLKGEGHPVVEFNAWETDFTWDPFFALWSEISAQFAQQSNLERSRTLANLARKLVPFLRSGATGASLAFAVGGESEVAITAAGVSATLREFDGAVDSAGQEHDAVDQTPFLEATYVQAKALLREFRAALREEASMLAGEHDGLPLVVLIDELDRCRPTYAIEILETAKHLFSVDRIVFVLCLDRAQLAHSVKAIYGSEFSADGYLRRFFDIDYRLPFPDRSALLRAAMHSSGLIEYVATRREFQSSSWYADPDFLVKLLGLPILSLRDSLQLMHRLGVIASSIPKEEIVLANALAVLLVLRTVNADMYRKVLNGTTTDADAVSALLGEDLKGDQGFDNFRAFVEGALAASICIATSNDVSQPDLAMVPMLQDAHQRDSAVSSGLSSASPESRHAGVVMACVNNLLDPMSGGTYEMGPIGNNTALQIAMRRMELFPPNLTDSLVG